MFHTSTKTVAPRKQQQRWIAALVALGLTATGVLVYTAAANAATQVVTYVSNAAGGTSTVTAEVMTTATTTFGNTSYYCNSTLTISSQTFVAAGASTWIILGDSCNLTINGQQGGGIIVRPNSALTFWGQTNNTGTAKITGWDGPGIGNTDASNGPITINGGHVFADARTTRAGYSYPGIGTSGTSALTAGSISINWNAGVYAKGTDSTSTSPAAAGIGTGTAGGSTSANPGTISIATTGMVQAFPGVTTNFSSAPGIGRGSTTTGNYTAVINTYAIGRSNTGPGTMRMQNWSGTVDDVNATQYGVAAGSRATYVAKPSNNAKLRTVDTGLTELSNDGVNYTYRLPITSGIGNITKYAYFWYSTTPTVTTTPAGTQTRPNNVTINGSITQNSTNALIGNNGQAQLWINNALAGTQNVTAGKVTFTHTAPPIGTYTYQIKYLGVTASPYLATSESVPLTGFEIIGATQNPLTLTGINTTGYTYGDAPVPVTVTGGSGTGTFDLTSANPTVASFGTITNGAGTLTINQAGTFTITGTRAGDTTYGDAVTVLSPTITVKEATPVASLTRTGGDTVTTPVNLTMTLEARGTGTTPQGLVQFTLNNKKLGDPLPLVDNGNGTASVSLTGIPLTKSQSQAVEAVYLGQTGKYAEVTKTDFWYLGADGFCLADPPPTP